MGLPEEWSWEKYDQLIVEKYINVQNHPKLPLTISNYSALAQYKRNWCVETELCRGLILDQNRNIIGRPFPKFFNYGETRLPNYALSLPPHVTTKQDGSLGVITKYNGEVIIATRGSFISDQALWAGRHWNKNHSHVNVPDGLTMLAEIIYPANKIVVDYEGMEALVLLAVIDNETGADIPVWEIDWWDGLTTETHLDLADVQAAHMHSNSDAFADREGVVMCWYRPGKPSFRLKSKHAEYVRLHRIITGVSNKTIWNHLKNGEPLNDILENVPDEFYQWAKQTITKLQSEFTLRREEIYQDFENLVKTVVTVIVNQSDLAPKLGTTVEDWIEYCQKYRRNFAEYAMRRKNNSCMFSLLDNKVDRVDEYVWEMIKPQFSRPFTNVGDDI